MKLLNYLQKKYAISRRWFTQLVDGGNVFLENKKIDSYKQEVVDWQKIKVTLPNKIIEDTVHIENDESYLILFNKPKWYVASKADENNQTIYEILPKEFANLYYIWRLDKDSHWLLLLTNDTNLVNEYTHPSHEVTKEYIVHLNSPITDFVMKWAKQWIEDEWEMLKAKKIELLPWRDKTRVKIWLNEWKKRHIRRMFRALWFRVEDLQRVAEWERKLEDIALWERRKVVLSKK
jgi:pseudouridine synthase